MNDTLHLGPETTGRPTVRGIVVVHLDGEKAPGYCWCEGPGKSISLVGATPADAARMRPAFGGKLQRWQVEHRDVLYWRTYTPPKMSLADRLRAAMAALRG